MQSRRRLCADFEDAKQEVRHSIAGRSNGRAQIRSVHKGRAQINATVETDPTQSVHPHNTATISRMVLSETTAIELP